MKGRAGEKQATREDGKQGAARRGGGDDFTRSTPVTRAPRSGRGERQKMKDIRDWPSHSAASLPGYGFILLFRFYSVRL